MAIPPLVSSTPPPLDLEDSDDDDFGDFTAGRIDALSLASDSPSKVLTPLQTPTPSQLETPPINGLVTTCKTINSDNYSKRTSNELSEDDILVIEKINSAVTAMHLGSHKDIGQQVKTEELNREIDSFILKDTNTANNYNNNNDKDVVSDISSSNNNSSLDNSVKTGSEIEDTLNNFESEINDDPEPLSLILDDPLNIPLTMRMENLGNDDFCNYYSSSDAQDKNNIKLTNEHFQENEVQNYNEVLDSKCNNFDTWGADEMIGFDSEEKKNSSFDISKIKDDEIQFDKIKSQCKRATNFDNFSLSFDDFDQSEEQTNNDDNGCTTENNCNVLNENRPGDITDHTLFESKSDFFQITKTADSFIEKSNDSDLTSSLSINNKNLEDIDNSDIVPMEKKVNCDSSFQSQILNKSSSLENEFDITDTHDCLNANQIKLQSISSVIKSKNVVDSQNLLPGNEDDFGAFETNFVSNLADSPSVSNNQKNGDANIEDPEITNELECAIKSNEEDEFADFASVPVTDIDSVNLTESFSTSNFINVNDKTSNVVDEDEYGDFADFECSAAAVESVPVSLDNVKSSTNQIGNTGLFDKIEDILKDMFPLKNEIPEVNIPPLISVNDQIWKNIKNVEETNALTYQWTSSSSNTTLLNSLGIDSRNILFGPRWNPNVPRFAANLGFSPLEPIKAHSNAEQPINSTKMQKPATTEEVPAAQFDWNSSGLTNPLDSGGGLSALLPLDLLYPFDPLLTSHCPTRSELHHHHHYHQHHHHQHNAASARNYIYNYPPDLLTQDQRQSQPSKSHRVHHMQASSCRSQKQLQTKSIEIPGSSSDLRTSRNDGQKLSRIQQRSLHERSSKTDYHKYEHHRKLFVGKKEHSAENLVLDRYGRPMAVRQETMKVLKQLPDISFLSARTLLSTPEQKVFVPDLGAVINRKMPG